MNAATMLGVPGEVCCSGSRQDFRSRCIRLLATAVLVLHVPTLVRAGFTDVSGISGPGLGTKLNSAWADYDNDGDPDVGTGFALMRNNAGTSFASVNSNWPRGLWGDYNNDGHTDFLSVGGNVRRNNGGGNFTTIALPDFESQNSTGACWADLDGDGDLDLYNGGGHDQTTGTTYPDSIYLNHNGAFSRHWIQSGPLYARGVTACDFDEDGDMDVYVSNYWLQPNLLWLNNGSAGFSNVAAAYGVEGDPGGQYPRGHTIGSCWGDFDNDGHVDLMVGNFRHPWGDGSQDHTKFFRNLGPGGAWHFQLEAELSGSAWQESYATPALADYDNDGDLDFFLTTVYDHTLTTGGVENHAVLFRNDGNWAFTDVTTAEGLSGLNTPLNYQAAWADYDDDGFLDLVTHGRLFHNQGNGNHWLKVVMKGDGITINRSAIGARARIDLGGGTILTRQVEGGTGEGNQNDLVLHFGLGGRTSPVDIDVVWPNGAGETVTAVAVDQTVTVTNSVSSPPQPPDSTLLLSLDARQPGGSPGTRWVDLSGKNQPFTSNGNPVHNPGSGTYTFNYNGLFTGNAADESNFDFDTDQGTGPTPFTVVYYASVNGNQSRAGMINKLATAGSAGWHAGLTQDEFGLNNVQGELRTSDNNNRTIVRNPGSNADPEPNSLNDIGVTASALNLYVMRFTGTGQGVAAVDTYINGATTSAFERAYGSATLSGASILNDDPLHIGGNTDHVAGPGGFRGDIRFIEIWSGDGVNGMKPSDYSAWRFANLDVVTTPPPLVLENPAVGEAMGFDLFAATGVTYRLEYSTSGAGGPWLDTGARLVGSDQTNTFFDPGGYSTQNTYRAVTD